MKKVTDIQYIEKPYNKSAPSFSPIQLKGDINEECLLLTCPGNEKCSGHVSGQVCDSRKGSRSKRSHLSIKSAILH